jgi:hypothetical protein
MIKKLLLMSTGIVLGCMITAASFAWPASQDCKDARADFKDVLEAVQDCRDNNLPANCDLKSLRACKRVCLKVFKAICTDGSYADAVPADVVWCDDCIDFLKVGGCNRLTIQSETQATIPNDRTRTKLGIGEEVTVSAAKTVTWSVAGGGSVSPIGGKNTIFTASKSRSRPIVKATVGKNACILGFSVIAPNGMKYSADNADAGGWPHTLGPPNNFIGNGRAFPITIQPTTVSFYNVEFRENKPGNTIKWPDGTVEKKVSAGKPTFDVLYNNGGASDSITSGKRPYSRLFDPIKKNYVQFTYTINVPLEYKNQIGKWTKFMAGKKNYHDKMFSAAGGCALKAVGNNTETSQYRGPWQN